MYLHFIIGSIFPLIAWISFILARIDRIRTGKRSSAVFIPFIGPVLINIGSAQEAHTLWLFLLPWLLDIGTLVWIAALPKLLKEAWNHSHWNQRLNLKGGRGRCSVALKLQKNKGYLLHANWTSENNEYGIVQISETGTYALSDNGDIQLTNHSGMIRVLRYADDLYFCLDDNPNEEHSLDGMFFISTKT